jgi:hypothetical protein
MSKPACDITYSGRPQEGELEKSATREQMELNHRREQREVGVCVSGYPLDRTKVAGTAVLVAATASHIIRLRP